MIRVLVVSGPNLDRLGKREPALYGKTTLAEIHDELVELGASLPVEVTVRQSNAEGELVTWVGGAADEGFDGVLLNAGGYTHTSVALLDAVLASGVPVVEVHLTNPEAREAFRRRSRIAAGCVAKVSGFGKDSYVLGLLGLLRRLGYTWRPQRP